MSALTTTPPNLVDDAEPTPCMELVLESVPSAAKIDERSAPELVTEQRVISNTAGAVPMPSTRSWTGATRVVAVAIRRIFVTLSADSPPMRRHYPPETPGWKTRAWNAKCLDSDRCTYRLTNARSGLATAAA
jgi:hypothetical protein